MSKRKQFTIRLENMVNYCCKHIIKTSVESISNASHCKQELKIISKQFPLGLASCAVLCCAFGLMSCEVCCVCGGGQKSGDKSPVASVGSREWTKSQKLIKNQKSEAQDYYHDPQVGKN